MTDTPTVPDYLRHIHVVLTRTSHPGNIGAAARAMKTMGLSRLTLVAPNLMATPMTPEPPTFDAAQAAAFRLPEESFILASGARDVLEQAQIVATLDEALADTVLSCALTSRRRELTSPLQTPRELTPSLLAAAQAGQTVALVFGNETFGLSIDEVQHCNRLMTISGNPDYFSLNLAQAVQGQIWRDCRSMCAALSDSFPLIGEAVGSGNNVLAQEVSRIAILHASFFGI